jgi:hypothetical protein
MPAPRARSNRVGWKTIDHQGTNDAKSEGPMGREPRALANKYTKAALFEFH